MSMVAERITLHPSLPPTTTMNTATTSAEAIKLEIERLKGLSILRACIGDSDHLTGAINRAKTGGPVARPAVQRPTLHDLEATFMLTPITSPLPKPSGPQYPPSHHPDRPLAQLLAYLKKRAMSLSTVSPSSHRGEH